MRSNPFPVRATGEITVSIDIYDGVLEDEFGEASQDNLRAYIEQAGFHVNGSEICDSRTGRCVGEVHYGWHDIEEMNFDAEDLIESYTVSEDENADEVPDDEEEGGA